MNNPKRKPFMGWVFIVAFLLLLCQHCVQAQGTPPQKVNSNYQFKSVGADSGGVRIPKYQTLPSSPSANYVDSGSLAYQASDSSVYMWSGPITHVWRRVSGGGSVVPGGVNKDVQYNHLGVFGGNNKFTYDTSSSVVLLDTATARNLHLIPNSTGLPLIVIPSKRPGGSPITFVWDTAHQDLSDTANEVFSFGYHAGLQGPGADGYFRIGMETNYYPHSTFPQYEFELPEVMLNNHTDIVRGAFFVQPKDRFCCGFWEYSADNIQWDNTNEQIRLGGLGKGEFDFRAYRTPVSISPSMGLLIIDSASQSILGGISSQSNGDPGSNVVMTDIYGSNNTYNYHHGILQQFDSIPTGMFGENYVITTPVSNTGNILWIGHDWGGAYRDDIRIFPSGHSAFNTNSGGDVPSAQVTVTSTTAGFLPPRMSTTQKLAISSPAEGLQVYDNVLHNSSYWNGSQWINVSPTISGSFSGLGAATTVFTVSIGTTIPSAVYRVNVTPTSALGSALFYVTNKTTTSFDVTYLAGLTGTVTFDWSVNL